LEGKRFQRLGWSGTAGSKNLVAKEATLLSTGVALHEMSITYCIGSGVICIRSMGSGTLRAKQKSEAEASLSSRPILPFD